MYTAKLFDDLFAYNPVMIINDNKSKTLLEALQNAINRSADFNVPGFDAIIRIDMYNEGVCRHKCLKRWEFYILTSNHT